jgi:hypothetical protein
MKVPNHCVGCPYKFLTLYLTLKLVIKLMHEGTVTGPGVWLVERVHQKCPFLVNKKNMFILKVLTKEKKRGFRESKTKSEGLAPHNQNVA